MRGKVLLPSRVHFVQRGLLQVLASSVPVGISRFTEKDNAKPAEKK